MEKRYPSQVKRSPVASVGVEDIEACFRYNRKYKIIENT